MLSAWDEVFARFIVCADEKASKVMEIPKRLFQVYEVY